LARDLADRHAQDRVIGIGIPPFVAGLKIHGQRRDLVEEIGFRAVQPQVERAAGFGARVGFIFGEARGVRQQILHLDRLPNCRRAIEVLRHAVLRIDLAFFHQHHDGGGRELFPDGTRLKYSLRLHRHIQLHIREAIALRLEDLAAPVDA
jgi:hypothetical protein